MGISSTEPSRWLLIFQTPCRWRGRRFMLIYRTPAKEAASAASIHSLTSQQQATVSAKAKA